MATFNLKKTESGHFNFSLVGKSGNTLLKSEQYNSKASCQNGIESVRKNASEESRYILKESSNGKFYFNLKAGNGQIIGTSPTVGSTAARDELIAELKTSAAKATVKEE
ncbi:YegP family protein [Neisseria sp.]|uniref:YegP family protein n=1 Tax=Neisseria sp. TaxID=192066 RepID=UPI0035A1C4ED